MDTMGRGGIFRLSWASMQYQAGSSPWPEGFPLSSRPVGSAPAWLRCCPCCKTKFSLSLPAGPGFCHAGKGVSKSDGLKTKKEKCPFLWMLMKFLSGHLSVNVGPERHGLCQGRRAYRALEINQKRIEDEDHK